MSTAPLPAARAPYASDPARSRGRLHPEPASPTRTEFQRDRDRIVHASAFRRLAYKSQVFVSDEGDHYRTRLTHTIEVAQVARALARALSLDDDLAEALALAHDLGHTPFGHSGEDTLADCMAPWGGFDHNAHTLRIVTALERRYATFDGLNLTYETLEGIAKHNGPVEAARTPPPIAEYDRLHPLALDTWPGLEAQAAALADDVAYDAHDLDDGLRSGLFTLQDLRAVPYLRGLLDEIAGLYPALEPMRVIHELVRRVITRFVEDVIGESSRRLAARAPADVEAVRASRHALVAFSPAMAEADRAIKAFLFPRMYRHPRVMAVRAKADQILRDLFARYMREPAEMPAEWRTRIEADGLARVVADYMAGMTDRFAVAEHRRLFAATPDLRPG